MIAIYRHVISNACTLAAALCLASAAIAQSPSAHEGRQVEGELGPKITGTFTVATMGDIIAPQPVQRSGPEFQRLVNIIRKSDVGFANMESSLVDFIDFPGGVGGTLAPLEMGQSLKSLGITMVNRANNHALDGGVAGMVSTDRALDQLGIVHAGTGPNLQEARAARFLETPKGRVGVVGMFSIADSGNFGPAYVRTEATSRNGSIGGTPGINPIHLTAYNVVSVDQLKELKGLALAAYGERQGANIPATSKLPERFRFYDQWYEAGAEVGAIHYDIEPADRRENLQAIRSGKVYSDFLIATIHAHQNPRFCDECGFGDVHRIKEALSHEPPDFLVALAHDAINNGADMFVTHGVHALAGIEIYKGKPVFYGLSNFIFQFGLQFGSGYDAMANFEKRAELENPASLQSVLATSEFKDGRLVEVRLYSVDLGGPERPISQLGIPLAARPKKATAILKALQDYSRAFGTKIVIEKGVGVIRIP